MAEIKLYELKETLYDIVGDKIIEFCEKTYYGDIICSFEQSYNGKEWTKEVEFASFENGTDLYYESDWNEGQTHLRNLRIWHLEDSEPVKHGRWKVLASGNDAVCTNCEHYWIPNGDQYDFKYCPYCGARMDEEDL